MRQINEHLLALIVFLQSLLLLLSLIYNIIIAVYFELWSLGLLLGF